MWKKLVLSALSLSLIAAANLHLCCSVTLPSQALPDYYSPQALRRGRLAAAAAANEICLQAPAMPEPELHYALRLQPPLGDIPRLSQALLDNTPGVARFQAVRVNGLYLGSVEDASQLRTELRCFIENQLPTWAQSGFLSQPLCITPQYSRPGSCTSIEDMVLLSCGAAPIIYSDGENYTARA